MADLTHLSDAELDALETRIVQESNRYMARLDRILTPRPAWPLPYVVERTPLIP